MLTFLLVLIIIASAILIVIILSQNPKGGGVNAMVGSQATQFLGVRQTGDFLEKATWYFGIGILVVVTASYFVTSSPTTKTIEKPKITNAIDYTPSSPSSSGNKNNGPVTPPQQNTPPPPPSQNGPPSKSPGN